ncbi:MAG TPA: hypothetical protein VG053_02340 [Solirubrobacteraceae bacterium]|jgi:hypothetical protein|nr:hypothetical protein [Solirubrobacteraceae bacterium]
MTRRRCLLAILTATATLTVSPTAALARSGDVAATRAYIRADYTLVHTARVNLATSEAALQRLRRQIAADCPKAAAGSPQDTDSEQLSNELVGAMTVAAIQPDVRAVTAFASTVERLHWSSAMLTRTIHSYATRLKTLSTLPAPNVCGDVQAWVAGRYLKLPASAVSFDRRYYKVEVAVGEVPARLLAPSEQPDELPVLARAEKIEGQLSEAEANAVYTWGHIMESLALSP